MSTIIAFVLTALHWTLIAVTRFVPDYKALFLPAFLYPSPVLLFFSLLGAAGLDNTGESTKYLLAALVYNVFKYFFIIRAMIREGVSFLLVTALLGDGLYLVASSFYLVYYSYL